MIDRNIASLIFFCFSAFIAITIIFIVINFIKETYKRHKEKQKERIKVENLLKEKNNIINKYINFIREGMSKEKAIDEMFKYEVIQFFYENKWRLDTDIVLEINDKSIATFNENYLDQLSK